MKREVGCRVGAIGSIRLDKATGKRTAFVLGFGVYEGEFVPDEKAVGAIAEIVRGAEMKNPRIKLDNGETVFGCECWWGGEDSVRKTIAGCDSVVNLTVAEFRAAAPAVKG